MMAAGEIEALRLVAAHAWDAMLANESAGWEPDGASVGAVDVYASAVSQTFGAVAQDLGALLGEQVEVEFSEEGLDDWAVPVYAASEGGSYAVADAVVRGWQYWLGVQLVQERNFEGVE